MNAPNKMEMKMKRIVLAISLVISGPASAAEYVQGYFRSDGTYVAPYFRSSPNSTTLDNYSYGNPYIYRSPSNVPPPVQYYIPKPYYGGSAYPYSRQ